MYPEEPNAEHLPGQIMHDLASEFVNPIRDLVVLHYKDMAHAGMEEGAAVHLAIQMQAFLVDYTHHVLVGDLDDTEETSPQGEGVEVDAEGIATVTVDEETAAALKDVLRSRGFKIDPEGGTA